MGASTPRRPRPRFGGAGGGAGGSAGAGGGLGVGGEELAVERGEGGVQRPGVQAAEGLELLHVLRAQRPQAALRRQLPAGTRVSRGGHAGGHAPHTHAHGGDMHVTHQPRQGTCTATHMQTEGTPMSCCGHAGGHTRTWR